MSDESENHLSTEPTVRPQPIAPWFHTASIIVILVLWASSGTVRTRLTVSVVPQLVTYASSVVVQYLLVGSTIAGLYYRRQFIRSVFGKPSAGELLRDFATGVVTYIGVIIFAGLFYFAQRLTHLHLPYRSDVIRALGPHSLTDLLFWLVVSFTAGLCEEFVFRGYLQQQLGSWFQNVPAAVIVSSLLFASMHFYQGVKGAVQALGLGVLYGIIAARRGNLRSVIISHALQDTVAGASIYFHYYR